LSNRPHKELTEKYLSKVVTLLNEVRDKPIMPDKFSSLTNSMLSNLHTHLTYHKGEISDIKERKCTTENGWTSNLSKINSEYNKLHNLYEKLKDEEITIRRIENQAHTRALIFRFLTTLSIGFGIMLVYWVAQQLNINMPLLKLPVGI